MEQKMQQYTAEKELIERADRLIEKIQGILKSFSINSKLNRLKTKKLVVDASYLVEKEMVKSFREAAEKLKERFIKYKFLISGPWPPYSFVSELPREKDG